MSQAIHVTILGMALVFLALAIVMLIAMILSRLFQPQPEEGKAVLPVAQADEESVEEETRIAAVIAATLMMLEPQAEAEAAPSWPQSVLTLKRIAQAWKAAGRLAGMR